MHSQQQTTDNNKRDTHTFRTSCPGGDVFTPTLAGQHHSTRTTQHNTQHNTIQQTTIMYKNIDNVMMIVLLSIFLIVTIHVYAISGSSLLPILMIALLSMIVMTAVDIYTTTTRNNK